MEVRYVAVVVIIFVSFYIAFSVKKRFRYRLYIGQALCDFIEYIKNQIEFFCTPTAEILENYEDVFLSECGLLPIESGDLEEGIVKSELSAYVEPRIISLLETFAKRLGRSSPDQQVANCEYTLSELRKYLEEEKTELPKRSKVYSALSVVSGFMAAILLL